MLTKIISYVKDKFFSKETNLIENKKITTVDEIMVPRSDIGAVKVTDSLKEICETFNKTGHTRLLVYKDEDIDNVLGFIHIKDVFRIIVSSLIFEIKSEASIDQDKNLSKFNLNSILRKPIIITGSLPINDLFNKMRTQRVHIALIIDEYGGTKGLATIEDVIEKQLGQIEDEYDTDEENDIEESAELGTFIVSGKTKIYKIESKLSLSLTDNNNDEYETIAGLIIFKLGYVPKISEEINLDNKILCTVLDSTQRAIKKLKLKILENNILDIKTVDNVGSTDETRA